MKALWTQILPSTSFVIPSPFSGILGFDKELSMPSFKSSQNLFEQERVKDKGLSRVSGELRTDKLNRNELISTL
jgi:hypothetical protein